MELKYASTVPGKSSTACRSNILRSNSICLIAGTQEQRRARDKIGEENVFPSKPSREEKDRRQNVDHFLVQANQDRNVEQHHRSKRKTHKLLARVTRAAFEAILSNRIVASKCGVIKRALKAPVPRLASCPIMTFSLTPRKLSFSAHAQGQSTTIGNLAERV